jgi:hypothetical protein
MGLRIWLVILSAPHLSAKLHYVSQERMTYVPAPGGSSGSAKVLYKSKDGKTLKTFDALDWLAQLTTHIPNKREQMVRYYGYYSNKSRGQRKKTGKDQEVPAIIDAAVSGKGFRKNWARLIRKIYNVDPLLCPKCQGPMRIISFIESPVIIRKILVYLKLWETRNHDPPAKKIEHITELVYLPVRDRTQTGDDSYSQISQTDYWLQ